MNDLTEHERQVLALVVEGRQNKEIAARLGLSDKTIAAVLAVREWLVEGEGGDGRDR